MRAIYPAIILTSVILASFTCLSTGFVSEENYVLKLVTAAFDPSFALSQEPIPSPTPTPGPTATTIPQELVNPPSPCPSPIPGELVNTPTAVPCPTPLRTPNQDSAPQTPSSPSSAVQTTNATKLAEAIVVTTTGSPPGASSPGIINATSVAALSCVAVGLVVVVGLIYRQKRRR